MLRLFYLNPRKAARRLRNEFSCGLGWTEMVRRFGFPTPDAAIGKVEYPGLDSLESDGRRFKFPQQ